MKFVIGRLHFGPALDMFSRQPAARLKVHLGLRRERLNLGQAMEPRWGNAHPILTSTGLNHTAQGETLRRIPGSRVVHQERPINGAGAPVEARLLIGRHVREAGEEVHHV